MANINVNLNKLKQQEDSLEQIIARLKSYENEITSVTGHMYLASNSQAYEMVRKSVVKTNNNLDKQQKSLGSMKNALAQIRQAYKETETNIVGAKSAKQAVAKPGFLEAVKQSFSKAVEPTVWKLFESFGILGRVTSAAGKVIKTGFKNLTTKDWLQFLKDSAGVVEKIGKAVGGNKGWKAIFGFDHTITATTPDSFIKNLFKEADKYNMNSAQNGAEQVSVVAKWAGTALTGLMSAYDNFAVNSEGNKWGRALMETVSETALKVGEGMLIGAGVTTAFVALGLTGPVVGSAAVVGAATVAATFAIDGIANSISQAIAGKDTIEAVSDLLLDGAGAVVSGVGKAAKNVGKTLSGWWNNATSHFGSQPVPAGGAW